MMQFDAKELDASELPAWRALISNSPDGSVYSDPDYLNALADVTAANVRFVGLYRNGNLEGGVALYERRSWTGLYVGMRLLLYYGGPVLARYQTKYPSEQTARHTGALTCLAEYLGEAGYATITFKGLPSLTDVRAFIAAGWKVHPAYSYVVDLRDLEAQWGRVEKNLRRLIKRCQAREGVGFEADNDFESFFRLHEATLARRGLSPYLAKDRFQAFFEAIAERGLAQICTARLGDGRAVASQLVLLGKHANSHTVSAAGDQAFASIGAQAFLRWRTFEHLAELGYTSNDLTDAALNSVTHFKSQFGGRLVSSFVLEAPMSLSARLGIRAERLAAGGKGLLRAGLGRLTARA